MKRWAGKMVICPFYKGEYRQEIFCEGLVKDSNIHQGFANPGLRTEHKQKYCETEYQSCPIAQMLENKWGKARD